jgi:GDP-mannose 6-dehydrogenase
VRINIYGLGYVGSVSAACLAADGHHVLGIDVDRDKVNSINTGRGPVIEPGLPELIESGRASQKLRATTDSAEDADVSMVCVGTPSNGNGSLCLDYILRATSQIGDFLRNIRSYHTVSVRSTVLPGTIQCQIIPLLERQSGKVAGRDFGVCMNPEFLREGTSIRDYYTPPFTVIGELDARSGDAVQATYANITAPTIRTNLGVAEMVKYAGNAFHALKITFANEIGNLCKRLGIDGTQVMEVFCQDDKLNISPAYLRPGFAFGGSCLPKDLRALLYKAKELDLEPHVLRSILASNESQVQAAYDLIRKTDKKKIAMLGLSFKPNTDDLRESPIAELVEILIGKGYQVAIYDREVSLSRIHGSNRKYIEQTIPHISTLMKSSVESAIACSDVVVVAKHSAEFDEKLKDLNESKLVIDLVRALPLRTGQAANHYEGICW